MTCLQAKYISLVFRLKDSLPNFAYGALISRDDSRQISAMPLMASHEIDYIAFSRQLWQLYSYSCKQLRR